MKLSDLVTSPESGRLSESRIWSHVGKGLVAFLLTRYAGQVLASAEVTAVLVGFLVMPELVKIYLRGRSQRGSDADNR